MYTANDDDSKTIIDIEAGVHGAKSYMKPYYATLLFYVILFIVLVAVLGIATYYQFRNL